MSRGRKKLPTKFHVLNGTDRPCRKNENEPMPDIDKEIPDPPHHLTECAKKEWVRMSRILYDNGLLTQLDYSEFEIYCQAYGRWVEAEDMMLKTGMVIKTAEGKKVKTGMVIKTTNGNIIHSPFVSIANMAMRDCHKYLSEFGMTPSSRTKVKGSGAPRKNRNKFAENSKKQANL